MSIWDYVYGTITVAPIGRSQEEKDYVLKTILNHLPIKDYADGHMNVYMNVKNGYDSSSSHNELGQCCYYQQDRYNGSSYQMQEEYLLTVDGAFRYETFDDTYRFFIKWLTRLAKRVSIYNILIQVQGYRHNIEKDTYTFEGKVINDYEPWFNMVEYPDWGRGKHEPTWCEFLLWKQYKDTMFPKELLYKYRDKYGLEKEDFEDGCDCKRSKF